MTFGLFNVIVAIYVENTVAAARHNVIRQKQLRLTDQYVFSSKVLQLVEFIWNAHQDHYGQTEMTSGLPSIKSFGFRGVAQLSRLRVTADFFEDLLMKPDFCEMLRDLEIPDEEHPTLFDTLDTANSQAISLEDLILGIRKLRGDARRSDIVSVGLAVRSLQDGFTNFAAETTRMLRMHNMALSQINKDDPQVQSQLSRRSVRSSVSVPSPKNLRRNFSRTPSMPPQLHRQVLQEHEEEEGLDSDRPGTTIATPLNLADYHLRSDSKSSAASEPIDLSEGFKDDVLTI
eukprot:CAMPEP_0206532346 /NCGR_PEP_ID=MMETSP0325_2-20121206/4316_1 /ASSEMBLY_ACC=CAM_ASM_000347 /TAXON_ID=2866 /ORGANISM="Crypthecodinium cohnii, Strain Seligo" /LENGTH=287 /DNA_ID=CAMNT_0054028783 /DNA_START=520 /DNA_END=1383 /DNA_ORIENTATION=-